MYSIIKKVIGCFLIVLGMLLALNAILKIDDYYFSANTVIIENFKVVFSLMLSIIGAILTI